jgi:hypothetical protein
MYILIDKFKPSRKQRFIKTGMQLNWLDVGIAALSLPLFAAYVLDPVDYSYKGALQIPYEIAQWIILTFRVSYFAFGFLLPLLYTMFKKRQPSAVGFVSDMKWVMLSPYQYIPSLLNVGYYSFSANIFKIISGRVCCLMPLAIMPALFPIIGFIYFYIELTTLEFSTSLGNMHPKAVVKWILFIFNVVNMEAYSKLLTDFQLGWKSTQWGFSGVFMVESDLLENETSPVSMMMKRRPSLEEIILE